jgi:hypothetical protein
MTKARLITALLFVGFWAVSPSVAGDVTVKVLKIAETRHKDVAASKGGGRSAMANPFDTSKLAVTIELAGKAIEKAVKYGYIKITSATTDGGDKLEVLGSNEFGSHNESSYSDINREFMYSWNEEKPKDRIKFDLAFKAPPRGVTGIAAIRGVLKVLTVDEVKTVTFDGIRSKQGSALASPVLQQAGVTVKVLEPAKNADSSKSVRLEMMDPGDVVHELKLVTVSGEDINASKMTMTVGSMKQIQLDSWEPLPKDVRLKVSVAVGQEVVEVPISLNNLPLP